MWIVAITEFRRLMRSGKLPVLVALTLLLALLAVTGTIWWWTQQLAEEPGESLSVGQSKSEPNLGLHLAWATLVLLLPVCLVAMPVLTADMVAGEREDGTLEMLELTALRPRELVLGKFVAAAAAALVLALSTLPFLILADMAGGPSLLTTFILIGTAVLYCLPFAAAGIGRSVRSATRAEAIRATFRDMLLWPLVGLGIALAGLIGFYTLRMTLDWASNNNRLAFWIIHGMSFPAGVVWTEGWDRIGRTPWFWLAVPIAITIHCLRRAWITAAWLEPMRVAETVQARRRARAQAEAAVELQPATPWATTAAADVRPPPMRPDTPWERVSRRVRNPVEVLATIHKRDAAWYFALLAWILPLLVVGLPLAVSPGLATRRGFLPGFAAFAWMGITLAYICMVTPTIVTSEREGGTLDALRMTRLRAADLVLGKVKPRVPELCLLLGGGALFMSVFFIWGSLSLGSLALLWVSGAVYVLAYSGFGAAVSVWCQRSTQAILAGWALLFIPMLLSLALVSIAGAFGHWVILPLTPLLVVWRCLVFELPDPTPGGVYLLPGDAYPIWALSLLIHWIIAIFSWWIALKQFDRFLYENRSGG